MKTSPVTRRLEETRYRLTREVRDNPLLCLGLAIGIGGVDLLAIQIARHRHVVGDRECNTPVAAPPQPGHPNWPRPGGIILRPMQSIFVPRRRHPERLVRITRQQRLSTRRPRPAHPLTVPR